MDKQAGCALSQAIKTNNASKNYIFTSINWVIMLKWDGHTHSEFCRHGSGEKTNVMVERAIELGFEVYSITEHAPLPPGIMDDPELAAEFTLLSHELDDYFSHLSDIKKFYSNKIKVLAGLEVDFIDGFQDHFDQFTERYLSYLDDLLVSIHMIKGKNGIAPIDYSPETFESELISYYGSTEEVHRAYWQCMESLVNHPIHPSLNKRLGHLGLISKFIKRYPIEYNDTGYNPDFARLFWAIKSQGWDLDYNVAGLKKDLCHDVYITDAMMENCRQYQIRLIYGSDAHDVESVGQFYDVYIERAGDAVPTT